jgi:DNA mismatch repair protein MutL
MPRVLVLPATVSDQIAAGEVVERPASVVKELVENALDAGAVTITVELEQGGAELIRVSDDGEGMDREDALLATERHATSKIRSVTDLIGVPTYGFRGEALASIASVSRFELETAPRLADGASGAGTIVRIRSGRREDTGGTARTHGTSVTVRKLFANVPARRKFLRAARSETRAAVEALTSLAMARLDVAFTLISDGRKLVDAPRTSDPGERLGSLFGTTLASQLVPVEHHDGYLTVRGFVQRPADARPAGRKAYLFVNGRPFRDPFLVRAAEAGYRATLPAGMRPSLFLSLALPGDRVDVNVHPAKLEVRFRDRYVIERGVEEAVRGTLGTMGAAAGASAGAWGGSAMPWESSPRPSPRTGGGEAVPRDLSEGLFAGTDGAASGVPPHVIQVFATFLVFETPEGLTIVDQHSAHERVIYERTMTQLQAGGVGGQRLLLPLTLDFGREELDAVERHREWLSRIGFEIEPFGGSSIVVQAVPSPHPRFDAQRCLEEVVTDLARSRFGAVANRMERFAATYGCRAAIKAGQALDPAEMRALLKQLFSCQLPPHDVHGRPTIVQLPRLELERRFGRA